MKYKILPVSEKKDIPRAYRNTPIGLLLEYHNLKRKLDKHLRAKLLVGMCMDNRECLRMPDNFAFIIRAGGANLYKSEFAVSYAIAMGGIKHIALIAHSNCGMANLRSRKKEFVDGLVKRAGLSRKAAAEHFRGLAFKHEIGNEIDFILNEAKSFDKKYPKITIAPLYYKVEDNRLYCIL